VKDALRKEKELHVATKSKLEELKKAISFLV